jgi:hypothetical protein
MPARDRRGTSRSACRGRWRSSTRAPGLGRPAPSCRPCRAAGAESSPHPGRCRFWHRPKKYWL